MAQAKAGTGTKAAGTSKKASTGKAGTKKPAAKKRTSSAGKTTRAKKSGSSARVLKRLSHTPPSVRRRNRECTMVHFPNSGGKSRQGEQPRAIQSTASMNSRLSAPLPPRSVLLPGTRFSIRAHCASLRVLLLKTATVFDLESEITQKGNPLNADAA